MKWFNKIFLKLVEWFHSSYNIKYVDDVPELISVRTIYIIGVPEDPWLLVFKCPCSCGNSIHLNLLKDAKPKWKFHIYGPNGKINISPSIRRTTGCKSHFIIQKNRTIWC
jgi:Family of unknown function (DUF6527)